MTGHAARPTAVRPRHATPRAASVRRRAPRRPRSPAARSWRRSAVGAVSPPLGYLVWRNVTLGADVVDGAHSTRRRSARSGARSLLAVAGLARRRRASAPRLAWLVDPHRPARPARLAGARAAAARLPVVRRRPRLPRRPRAGRPARRAARAARRRPLPELAGFRARGWC